MQFQNQKKQKNPYIYTKDYLLIIKNNFNKVKTRFINRLNYKRLVIYFPNSGKIWHIFLMIWKNKTINFLLIKGYKK